MSVPKTKLRRILLVVLPVGLLLIGAEIALRILNGPGAAGQESWQQSMRVHRASSDPELIYEYRPGARSEFGGKELVINSAGFRDDEFPPQRDAGAPGIVLLGDSVASGWGVAMADAFPQRLERLLQSDAAARGAARPVVYNLAVNGYSTAQEVRLLETRGVGYEPDLVIVSYVLNDPDRMDGGLARAFESSRIELVHLARRAIRSVSESMRGLPSEYHHRVHERHANEIAAQFERLGRLARERSIPILVAVVPVFGGGEPYPWQDVHDDIEKLSAANQLQFLDLRPALLRGGDREIAFDVWHPSEVGHELIAAVLAAKVRELTAR